MARTKAQNVAEPVDTDAPRDVTGGLLDGVKTDAPTTPPGDAKEQARQARRAALEAKKAEIAAKAAGNGSAPKPDAPKPDAPKDEPKAEETAPLAPAPKLTTSDKLRELVAISEDRRDYAKVVKEMVTGIEAILADLAKAPSASQPKATRPRDDAAKTKANSELEATMLTIMQEKGAVKDGTPITLQDVMRAMGSDMKDAKPYNAMVRMRNDGRVSTVVDKAPRQFVVA